MRIAIRLCIKDFRRYWLYILIIESLVVLRALVDILLPLNSKLFDLSNNAVWDLVFLACCFVAALAVQADSLTGDRQSWLTRPISWQNLLAGKFLFLICVVNLPVLLAQSAAMLANGLSPMEHLSRLIWMQFSLTAFFLVAALIASITRNLKQAALFVVAGLAILILIQSSYGRPFSLGWGSADVLQESLLALSAILITSILLWVQYSQRTLQAAMIWVFSVLLAALVYFSPLDAVLWGPLAHFRARMAGVLLNEPPVTITFHPEFFSRKKVGGWGWREDAAILNLPVRVAGIPKDCQLMGERIKIEVLAPDRVKWESGWDGLRGFNMTQFSQLHAIIPADGDYPMPVKINWKFYERIQRLPVQVRARLTFRLLGPPIQKKHSIGQMVPAIKNEVFWGGWVQQRQFERFCIFSKPQSMTADESFIDPAFFTSLSIGHAPGISIWSYTSVVASQGEPDLHAISVRKEKAWFETTLNMQGMRLSDYFCGRTRP